MQLVYQFIQAVKRRLLQDGDRLPGSRKIAEQLQIHRKTVVAALQELEAQDWIESIPNVGTFVRDPDQLQLPNKKHRTHPPKQAPYAFTQEMILDLPTSEKKQQLYFTDGTPDHRWIDVQELLRFYAAVLKRKNQGIADPDKEAGGLFFRDQLSYYLNLSRGFLLSRTCILPIMSREQIFSILTRLLIQQGDTVLVETLSYYLPNMIFNQAGAHLSTVPIDTQGMDVEYIRRHFKPGDIRFVYLNSRCQYPSTRALSLERKKALVELASAYDFIIIEDDVDFESSHAKSRDPSLFSLDGGHRVIYIGSFGGFLHPEFQMHFLIAPEDLLREARKYQNIYGKANFMLEKALGEMIQQGDILRYQRKAHKLLEARKQVFETRLKHYFQDQIRFSPPSAGMAFWLEFKEAISLSQLQNLARKQGLLIPRICLYQNHSTKALRLGFAHLDPEEIEKSIQLLYQSYQALYTYPLETKTPV